MKIKGYEAFIIAGIFVLALMTISNQMRTEKTLIKQKNILDSVLIKQRNTIDSLLQEERNKDSVIDSLQQALTIQHIIEGITATMYHPTPEQCDDTPNITADGSMFEIENASWYKWIAVSQDLIYEDGSPLRFNDEVAILNKGELIGTYKVKDVMNLRWTNRIDFLESPGTPLYEYKNVTLVKL